MYYMGSRSSYNKLSFHKHRVAAQCSGMFMWRCQHARKRALSVMYMLYPEAFATLQMAKLCVAQVPQMANLGLNNVSHALAGVPGGPQAGGFLSGGSYHSAHGMQLQAPAPQVAMPQAYAQVGINDKAPRALPLQPAVPALPIFVSLADTDLHTQYLWLEAVHMSLTDWMVSGFFWRPSVSGPVTL